MHLNERFDFEEEASELNVEKCPQLAKCIWMDRQFCHWMIDLQSCKSRVEVHQHSHDHDQEPEVAPDRVHALYHNTFKLPHQYRHEQHYVIAAYYSNWTTSTRCVLHSNWNEYVIGNRIHKMTTTEAFERQKYEKRAKSEPSAVDVFIFGVV